MSEKMSVKEQSEIRAKLYEMARGAIEGEFTTETIATGALIHLPGGQYAELQISIKDVEKFDLTKVREAFALKQSREAERAKKAAEKATANAEKKMKAAAEAREVIE